jgi:hypothetical protein
MVLGSTRAWKNSRSKGFQGEPKGTKSKGDKKWHQV